MMQEAMQSLSRKVLSVLSTGAAETMMIPVL